MKILVHLNHGVDKSYMLNFGNRVRKEDIKEVLQLGQNDAAQVIFGYASLLECVEKVEIPEKEKNKAGFKADFIVGHQGRIAE